MIKTKMQLAHEMALAIQGTKLLHDMELVSDMAWKYADAMQAEADERKCKERPEVLRIDNSQQLDIHGLLHSIDEYFDQAECTKTHRMANNLLAEVYEKLSGEVNSSGEWQPDWSQAPEWAKYWAVRDGGKTALWCINKPTVTDDCFLSHGGCSPAPSFGLTGSRIVERPQ